MKKLLIIMLILTFVMVGCSVGTGKENAKDTGYKKISAEEAKKIMDSEEIIVLDVRTLEEYSSAHIENAVLLPVTEIAAKAEEALPDKDAKILVYCRSGNRSATAARELINMGYTNVYDFGGINSWPYEVVK